MTLVMSVVESNPDACSCKDPHLTLAYGGAADFRGRDGAFYAFVSSPRSVVNVKTQDARFMLKGLLVEGSFLTEVHAVGTTAKGRRFTVSFRASDLDEHHTSSTRMVNGAAIVRTTPPCASHSATTARASATSWG